MAEPSLPPQLVAAIRSGGEALDRGTRGPAREFGLLHEAGLLRAPLPVELGGRGWGTSAQGADAICDLLMALGGAALPIARLFEGHVNAIRLIDLYGTPDQRTAMADVASEGGLLGVWGADGVPPVRLATEDGVATLTGVKVFASGLGDVALAIVVAGTDAGPQMVLVAADDPARADPSALGRRRHGRQPLGRVRLHRAARGSRRAARRARRLAAGAAFPGRRLAVGGELCRGDAAAGRTHRAGARRAPAGRAAARAEPARADRHGGGYRRAVEPRRRASYRGGRRSRRRGRHRAAGARGDRAGRRTGCWCW